MAGHPQQAFPGSAEHHSTTIAPAAGRITRRIFPRSAASRTLHNGISDADFSTKWDFIYQPPQAAT
jgi:hypothetical protein